MRIRIEGKGNPLVCRVVNHDTGEEIQDVISASIHYSGKYGITAHLVIAPADVSVEANISEAETTASAEREECINVIKQYLLLDSQRAVSWHEVQDAIDAIRLRRWTLSQ